MHRRKMRSEFSFEETKGGERDFQIFGVEFFCEKNEREFEKEKKIQSLNSPIVARSHMRIEYK